MHLSGLLLPELLLDLFPFYQYTLLSTNTSDWDFFQECRPDFSEWEVNLNDWEIDLSNWDSAINASVSKQRSL